MESEVAMTDVAGRVPPANLLPQPTAGGVVNSESREATGEAPGLPDAQMPTSMDGSSADTSMAPIAGELVGELLSRAEEEREEGECSSSDDGDLTQGTPVQYTPNGLPMDMDCETPEDTTGNATNTGSLKVASELRISDASTGEMPVSRTTPSEGLGNESPSAPATTGTVSKQVLIPTADLANNGAVPRSLFAASAKRALSPPMLDGSDISTDASKRQKTTLDSWIGQAQDVVSEKPPLFGVQHASGASQTPAVVQDQGHNKTQGHLGLTPQGVPGPAATNDVQSSGENGVSIKEEPKDESSSPFATTNYPDCGVHILDMFGDNALSPFARERLNVVQDRMNAYVAGDEQQRNFNLVEAVKWVVPVGKARRKTINRIQEELVRLRVTRSRLATTSRLPEPNNESQLAQPAFHQPSQSNTSGNQEQAGLQDWPFGYPPFPPPHILSQGFGNFQLPLRTVGLQPFPAQNAFPAQNHGPQSIQQAAQATGFVQHPLAVSVFQRGAMPPPSVSRGLGAQPQMALHNGSAPSVAFPHHGLRGTIQGRPETTPGQLTVLTLPRMNIDPFPQVQQFAKDVLDEANSLLTDYSNVRLAFSAHDMARR